jgi:hypothetical protein
MDRGAIELQPCEDDPPPQQVAQPVVRLDPRRIEQEHAEGVAHSDILEHQVSENPPPQRPDLHPAGHGSGNPLGQEPCRERASGGGKEQHRHGAGHRGDHHQRRPEQSRHHGAEDPDRAGQNACPTEKWKV